MPKRSTAHGFFFGAGTNRMICIISFQLVFKAWPIYNGLPNHYTLRMNSFSRRTNPSLRSSRTREVSIFILQNGTDAVSWPS
jgi:hypothetical protein